ncbi:MAG: hypothetical protein ACKO7W_18260 [Elainella sp.]
MTIFLLSQLNIDALGDNILHQAKIVAIQIDGTVAYLVIGLSLLIGVIPASGLFLGQLTSGFLLVGFNFAVQLLANQGTVTDAMLQNLLIDALLLGIGLYCAAAITDGLLNWFVALAILAFSTLVFGLPGAIERCANICPLAFLQHYI